MYCFDFKITEENAVDLSNTLVKLISQAGTVSSGEQTSGLQLPIDGSAGRVSSDEHAVIRVSKLAGIFAEDMLMSIIEKNPAGAKIDAEMMVILDDAGVRLIQRDSSVLIDIMEGDSELSSFRDYIISRTVTLSEYKSYMIATGHNRNEIYLSYQTDSLQI